MRTGIALGSNLGDRMQNLVRGFIAASSLGEDPTLVSRIYETAPVDCAPGSPAYLNAVMEFEFDGDPHELFDALKAAETAAGRPAIRGRNESRTLDLDILYCGDTVLRDDKLQLPHPRLHLRRFVLQPLRDIRPDLVLPGFDATVADLLNTLPPKPEVRIHAELFPKTHA